MDGFGAGLKMRSKMLRNRKPSLQFPPRLTGHWPAQPKLFCSSDEFHLQLPQSNQLHTLQWCIITVRGWITPAFAALLTCTRTREHFAYRSPDRLHNCSCKPKCSKVIIKKKHPEPDTAAHQYRSWLAPRLREVWLSRRTSASCKAHMRITLLVVACWWATLLRCL